MAQDTDKEREPLSRIARLRNRTRVARDIAELRGIISGILDLLEDDYRLGTQEGGS